jgi:hypothetical protein
MALSQKRRRLLLGAALALTLAAVGWIQGGDNAADGVVEPQRPPRSGMRRAEPGTREDARAPLRLGFLRRTPAQDKVQDAFAAQSWYVPPPRFAAPSALAAPPLPFSYMGKMLEDGKLTVFLTGGQRNYVVKVGDVIDGTYRVDAIDALVMTLTYLPLNIKQTIQIGGLN